MLKVQLLYNLTFLTHIYLAAFATKKCRKIFHVEKIDSFWTKYCLFEWCVKVLLAFQIGVADQGASQAFAGQDRETDHIHQMTPSNSKDKAKQQIQSVYFFSDCRAIFDRKILQLQLEEKFGEKLEKEIPIVFCPF